MFDWVCSKAEKVWTWIAHGLAWATAIIGSLNFNDWIAALGLFVSACVAAYSMYHQRRRTTILEQVASQNAKCAICPKMQEGE